MKFCAYLLNESTNDLHLVKKYYDKYNTLYFEGKLPKNLPIAERSLKNAVAQVEATVLASTYDRKFSNKIEPDKIDIKQLTISSSFLLSEEQLQGILLHEMVHIKLFTEGIFQTHGSNKSHGLEFLVMRRELQQRSGIHIPTTETSIDLIRVGKGKEKYGLMYKRINGPYGVMMFSSKLWSTNKDGVMSYFYDYYHDYILKQYEEIFFFKTTDPAFDGYPSSIKIKPYGMKFYLVKNVDRDKIKDSDIIRILK